MNAVTERALQGKLKDLLKWQFECILLYIQSRL